MVGLFYYFAFGLFIIWLPAHFVYHYEGVHALLILAALLVIIRIVIGDRSVKS